MSTVFEGSPSRIQLVTVREGRDHISSRVVILGIFAYCAAVWALLATAIW